MIILSAIAHGRSDGFITAATESRQEECISWGFKIQSGDSFAYNACVRRLPL